MEKYEGEDFAIITLDRDKEKDVAIKYIEDNDFEFTEWAYDTGDIFNEYKGYNNDSNGIPQTVIIDRDGNVRYTRLGGIGTDAEMFTVVIDDLL